MNLKPAVARNIKRELPRVVQNLVCRCDWRGRHPEGESAEQLEVATNKVYNFVDRARNAVSKTNRSRVPALCLMAGFSVVTAYSAALIDAVQNDDRAQVVVLLSQHPDVNALDEDGSTALAWAAMRCNREIAAMLLKSGANPNLMNEQGIGPLYLAITNGSAAMVQLLLANGANPDLAREDGETVLMTATRTGAIDMMRMLLERGARVEAREKQFGQTALMWAAGHPEAVSVLIEHGADVRATSKVWDITSTIYTPTTSTIGKTGIPWNNDGVYTSKQGGQNALHFAVQKHDLESARLLLKGGVDVNMASADGTTPLLAALYKWDPLGKEFVGGTGAPAPSGSSARFGADVAMANFLLDKGAKVNVADGPATRRFTAPFWLSHTSRPWDEIDRHMGMEGPCGR